ncbi:hypothetical protein QFC22_005044 [Naganishia vaughanmartiniae]|uniref:Uncharacterized protein n=1 Tax=Naganishia vaughanmartiniae TaxID=1424756 RepID=A0ACC2WYM2_9TREE|nr:hypothetical protein QFC22_005044 [Naganishia vaughanmartiniae]
MTDLYVGLNSKWVTSLRACGTDLTPFLAQKDYIPGYGDCVDLAILAVGWDKDRARELRGELFAQDGHKTRSPSAIVGPSVMTTLYAGVLTNKAQVAQRKQDPHFEILFRVSYGLTKQQLAELNNALGSILPIYHACRRATALFHVAESDQLRAVGCWLPKDTVF